MEQSIHLSNLLVEVADKKKLGKKEETKASVKPKTKEKSSYVYRVNQQCYKGGNCPETPQRPSAGHNGRPLFVFITGLDYKKMKF